MKRLLLVFILLGLVAEAAWAQRTVTGTVTSATDGIGVPGASVLVKGSSLGVVTDVDGKYKIEVPSNEAVLVISFVGYMTTEEKVGNRSVINVALKEDVEQLSEVVITAIGIERDKRSLGYATQEVKGEALANKSTTDAVRGLEGKIAGVNITGSSGSPGASTNINIRGISSFTGSNQPLFIVDGIPISNNVDNTQNTLFGTQPANRAADIDPNNIESITVLKGPAAAVLYGSRASAGAIIITTKSGRNTQGKTEVVVNSSYNMQQVSSLPKFQNQYGQGSLNEYVANSTNSWGPSFGTPGYDSVTTTWGQRVPYQAYPDNIKDFYQTGQFLSNNVSITSGNEVANYLLSFGNTTQKGIIPNSGYDRTNVQLKGSTTLNNGLIAGGSINYIRSSQEGIPGGNGASAFGQITRIPRSYDLTGLPYSNAAGNSQYYSLSANHPLWSANNELFESKNDRILGNIDLGYKITDWLKVDYRLGLDTYSDRRKLTLAINSGRVPSGEIRDESWFRSELNSDLLVTATKKGLLLEGLNASVLVGNNINQRNSQSVGVVGQGLSFPGFFNQSGASSFTNSFETSSIRRLVGFYGQVSFDYENFAFLEFTGRTDQSSTLPKENNMFFYPSVTASLVVTDMLKLDSDILSYGKIRGNIAKVGRDADPYSTETYFVSPSFGNNVASVNFPYLGLPGFAYSSQIGSNTLTPEFTTSYEVGANLGFFRNSVTVDVTYFSSESSDQIMPVAVANASGFNSRYANVGLMTNKGIEALVNATVLRRGDFKWDVTANYSRIRNMVVEITEGVKDFPIPGNGFGGITPSIAEGHPYGVIISSAFPRNDAGQLLINPSTGLFQPSVAGQVIADPNPDWLGGITNTLSYKGINFSVLVDTRQGGDLYSFSAQDLKSLGAIEMTAVERDQPRILPGVIEGADGTFTPNNIQISAQQYWQALGGLASEAAVYDATVYRLREVSLGYSIPKNLISKSPFGDIFISVSGRNLLYYAPNFFMDPEINTQGAGNIRGMDLNGAPNTRSYGVNLRFTL
ncbi:SusC/RagA family TonB-linked outer membrane protein [Cesiribacter sp. SM1]|uniref:SusC/RagA family TonB-linked outer membrane protein n=1 Tax=Cesiribacter sp. SM1 TaxID=2861196 RepID=UPI001CD61264|nr:SusC/RagA family TonB-linked outer membrane protein [Cesiribacter sp. SM1]